MGNRLCHWCSNTCGGSERNAHCGCDKKQPQQEKLSYEELRLKYHGTFTKDAKKSPYASKNTHVPKNKTFGL